MKLHPLAFAILILICINSAWARPGTYKGGKILTSFGVDSMEVEGEMRYFNYDTLLYRIMTEGYTPEVQNINVHYLVDIVDHMTYEGQLKQIERYREAGRKYKSRQLELEADFMRIWYFPDTTDNLFEVKAQMLDEMIARMEKEGEIDFEIRCRELICHLYWEKGLYARPFVEFPALDRLLDKITNINESGVNAASKKKFYYWFGQCYYMFRDYDKAIRYYKKATGEMMEYSDKPFHMYDATNLLAHIALGRYYREMGDLDASDSHFRSMLESPDDVKRRPLFNAMAYCNLGKNMQLRQDYPEAIQLMIDYLPGLTGSERYSQAAEIAVSLGEAYLASGKPDAAKEMADSAFLYIEKAKGDKLPSLYRLMSKYYAVKGDIANSNAFLDSSAYYQKAIDNRYNALVILRAEQQLFETEKREMLKEKSFYKIFLIHVSVIACLILLLLSVYIYLYLKKTHAYRELVRRTQEWAGLTKPDMPDIIDNVNNGCGADSLPSQKDSEVFEAVCTMMKEAHLYRDPALTLDTLAKQMNINRQYLSQAINCCSGKNFTNFINEYRIREAVIMISADTSKHLSLEGIAFEVGFNQRKSFYSAFKKITGLSPSDYRSNLHI